MNLFENVSVGSFKFFFPERRREAFHFSSQVYDA